MVTSCSYRSLGSITIKYQYMVDMGKDSFIDLHHLYIYIYSSMYQFCLETQNPIQVHPLITPLVGLIPSDENGVWTLKQYHQKRERKIKGAQTTPLGTITSKISQISFSLILCKDLVAVNFLWMTRMGLNLDFEKRVFFVDLFHHGREVYCRILFAVQVHHAW